MNLKLYLVALAFILVGFNPSFAQESEPKPTVTLTPEGQPKLKLSETEFDFGDIIQGQTVQHVFTFVNDGSAPLVISKINTPCGCTVPNWPTEPIPPGASGEITVKFNSTGKMGNQVKNLSIIYNGESSPDFITIKGKVIPKTTTAN
jgi:hypothetical protein